MPFLTPKPGWIDWWSYSLTASAGRHDHEIIIYSDDSVEIALDYATMGIKKHRYHLYGNHRKYSDGYGWISIHRVEKVTPTPNEEPQDLNINDFEGNIALEYFRIVRSPHFQETGMIAWNQSFDVLVLMQDDTLATIEGLRYMDEYPSEDYKEPDMHALEEVAGVLAMLDRHKFRYVESSSL